MLYLVTYDLMKPGQNYDSLISTLRALRATRVLLSTWVLRSNKTAGALRDEFKAHIDQNDRVLVAEMPGAWAAYNALADINKV
jgi:hypothetical protein